VRFAGLYGLLVGIMMFAQWLFFLITGQVPELHTEPYRIALHLAAEFITALGISVSAIGLIMQTTWGAKAYLLFSGMLVYSMVASPGYFAQQGQWALVGMFAVLLALAMVSLSLVWRKIDDRSV
jgi:hypothetical protein